MSSPQLAATSQSRTVSISDNGTPVLLHYNDLESYHMGDSWWGCTVGFRAMQVAANVFAQTTSWDRYCLYVVSGHPGQGVKDAIEFVTHCISKKRFELTEEMQNLKGCSRNMQFKWWISNGSTTVFIQLRDGHIPALFFDLLDRLGTEKEIDSDREEFDQLKMDLSQQGWQLELDEMFNVRQLSKPLSIGEIPHA